MSARLRHSSCSWFGKKGAGRDEASWSLGSQRCWAVGAAAWLAGVSMGRFSFSAAALDGVALTPSMAL